jgi:hypothetical protein
MATTPNFNWSTPDNTGLVKNGALDIRTLGNSIDASMAELKGGTTGQVLSKTSNTDMDFTWVAQDDSNAIQNAIVDAKGDIIAATANDTPARLAVGANNRVLMADSTAATGLKYGGDWVSYTPSFNGLTVGNGTLSAAYTRVGDLVTVSVRFAFGSTSAITGAVYVALPITAAMDYEYCGQAALWNLGGAAGLFPGLVWAVEPGRFVIAATESSGTYTKSADLSATVPFTWATGNYLRLYFSYKVA